MKNIEVYKIDNQNAKDTIRLSNSAQYQGLEDKGAFAVISSDFLDEAEVIGTNGKAVAYDHPVHSNTSILVFGRNSKYAFGVITDTVITSENGMTINIPNELLKSSWALKMSSSTAKGTRGFLVTNVDKAVYGKTQLEMEEAIISLKKFGDIRPIKNPENTRKKVIHHKGFPFDLKIDSIMLLSKQEHRAIHEKQTQASHNREVYIHKDENISEFVGKEEMRYMKRRKAS